MYGVYLNMLSLLSRAQAGKKAFKIFATVRKGRILSHQATYLDSAKYEMLEINNHIIQTYRWQGSGNTVVLIHGWESNSFRWRNLIAKLQKAKFNIIAFDAPAHGYSSGQYMHVPLYASVLNKIITRYTPKYLVSHSIGGMATLYNEFKDPSTYVKKIVAVAAPCELNDILYNFQLMLGFNNMVMHALKTYILETLGFNIDTFSAANFVQSNTKKGLLFHDRLDKITPYHASVAIQANWPESQLVSTSGLGHSMHQDEINDTIVKFLER